MIDSTPKKRIFCSRIHPSHPQVPFIHARSRLYAVNFHGRSKYSSVQHTTMPSTPHRDAPKISGHDECSQITNGKPDETLSPTRSVPPLTGGFAILMEFVGTLTGQHQFFVRHSDTIVKATQKQYRWHRHTQCR